MGLSRRAVLISSSIPLVLMGALSVGYLVDGALQNDRVVRNVTVAGEDVSGMNRSELQSKVQELAAGFPETPVVITADDLTLESTAGNLGYEIDVGATVDRALALGHEGYSPARAARWLGTLFDEYELPVVLNTDEEKLNFTVLGLEGDRRTDPINPRITFTDTTAELAKGTPGRKIDTSSITNELPGSLDTLGEPIELTATRQTIPPPISDDVMTLVKGHLDNVLGSPFTLKAGERSAEVTAEQIVPLLSVDSEGDEPEIKVDAEAAAELVADELPTPSNPTGVKFTMGPNGPTPQAGRDAVVCCDTGAGTVFAKAVEEAEHDVDLPTTTVSAAEGVEEASKSGVKEKVASFTTQHPAGQPRVQNIHRIADLTRGVYIPPGGSFSVNDFVGQRTEEKGFVSAPVIEDGVFTKDTGGGISQYATTLFNAAFFGGLDIPRYKAHSVYISRYPFGREATLAYPGVDLKITNPSPYGVVIWPTYTNSSITVDLYSTKWANAEQTAQSGEKEGEAGLRCGNITTRRTITIVATGEQRSDTFNASYVCEEPETAD
ncbi:MAG: VanW family protein [Microthrixaceae bacterium]